MVKEYEHRIFWSWQYITTLIICVLFLLMGLYEVIFADEEINWFLTIYLFAYPICMYFVLRQKNVTTIDEVQRIIFNRGNVKSPVKIDEIKDICIKESKKGKFCGQLVLHTYGVRFMNLMSDKENAYRIIDHLKRLNPTIEVKSNTHII